MKEAVGVPPPPSAGEGQPAGGRQGEGAKGAGHDGSDPPSQAAEALRLHLTTAPLPARFAGCPSPAEGGGEARRPALLDLKGLIFLALLGAAAILVPAANLLPESSPFHVPTYAVSLLGKYLAFALLAVALDLVWGYAGILSLGHGAFFALGGYAMGMYLMRQIGPRGTYAHPVLPDFMVFLNWTELPWYWQGFDRLPFAALMVVLVPGALAFAFGALAFRSRVTGVYLSIITQAMTFALMLAFFRNDMGLGGNNGLTDFKDIAGFPVQAKETRVALFVLTAAALAGGYLLARSMTTSAFGKVLLAIRDAESRARFLGYRVERYKALAFTVSAMMAGVAGALYVPQVGIINPSEFAPAGSIEAVIWVAVGGRGTLVGAALGAVLCNFAKTTLTGALPELWLFALGGLFVGVTLFLPRGIVGTLEDVIVQRRAKGVSKPVQEGGQGAVQGVVQGVVQDAAPVDRASPGAVPQPAE